jgi:hypothetical protein
MFISNSLMRICFSTIKLLLVLRLLHFSLAVVTRLFSSSAFYCYPSIFRLSHRAATNSAPPSPSAISTYNFLNLSLCLCYFHTNFAILFVLRAPQPSHQSLSSRLNGFGSSHEFRNRSARRRRSAVLGGAVPHTSRGYHCFRSRPATGCRPAAHYLGVAAWLLFFVTGMSLP